MKGPELRKLAEAMGMPNEEEERDQQLVKFQRAVDIWGWAKQGGDFDTLLKAIDSAWRDGELEYGELVGLLAHTGLQHPAINPCQIAGLFVDRDHWYVELHSSKRIQLNPILPEHVDTPARRYAEQTPELSLAQADAAFEDLDKL